MKLRKMSKDHVTIPTRAQEGDVGFDVHCWRLECLDPGVNIISTQLQVIGWVHPDTFAKVEGRGSLAKKGIFPIGGIIDPNYRGEIKVVLFNSKATPVWLSQGERFAQLVFYRVRTDFIQEGELMQETNRGDGHFGSTGK